MKSRQIENEIVLPVPSEFNIEPEQEFIAVKGERGSITYLSKVEENIFDQA